MCNPSVVAEAKLATTQRPSQRSKWAFLRDLCTEFALTEAAEIAGKIEVIMSESYGSQVTHQWIRDYPTIEQRAKALKSQDEAALFIDKIAADSSYCIACDIARGEFPENPCEACAFAKKAGKCESDSDSLFHTFRSYL